MRVSLTDICDFQGGTQPPKDEWSKECKPGYVRMLQIRDFTQSEKDYVEYIRETSSTKKCTEEDILIGRYGASVGKILTGLAGAYNVAIIKTIPDRTKVHNRYLFHYFNSPYFQNYILSVGSRAAQAGFNKNDLQQAIFPLISISEQEQIACKLDNIDNVLALTCRQMDKLDELVKSRFIELFGDPIINPLNWKKDIAGKHIDLLLGFPFDSSQYTDSGVNICGGLIIMPQRIDWHDCKHWRSVEGYEDYILQENDIVIALDRPWIAEGFKIAMVDANHLPALLIQRTARIRAIDINQQYLMACFTLGGFEAHCNVTGSLVPHISAKDIRSFSIMLPPIELQNEFAAFVEHSNKLKLEVKQSLEKLETLKKSLMQEYFG